MQAASFLTELLTTLKGIPLWSTDSNATSYTKLQTSSIIVIVPFH
jgi:hypothetical protein